MEFVIRDLNAAINIPELQTMDFEEKDRPVHSKPEIS